ncbi:MAG: AbgT family transporter [Fusobacteriaceae bacterium]|nr:AbgT family transporter [Fusobacteriaceae bacterium]
MKSGKKRTTSFSPFAPICCVILLSVLATRLIPPGVFERVQVSGRAVIVPGSFHPATAKSLSFFSVFLAIPYGFIGTANLIFLILLVGGAIEVYNRTGAIAAGLHALTRKTGKTARVFLLFFIFCLLLVLGGFFGWVQAAIPFVPLVVPLVLSLGFDPLVAAAVVILGLLVGFCAGPSNLYTVGVAQQVAGLPLFSGFGLRLLIFGVFGLLSFFFILRQIKKDAGSDNVETRGGAADAAVPLSVEPEGKCASRLILAVIFLTFGLVTRGMLYLDWGPAEIAAAFTASGIVAGILRRFSTAEIAACFTEGAKNALTGAMIVGTAGGVQWVLEKGCIIDPIIYYLSGFLSGLPPLAAAVGVSVIVALVGGLIPSGSGKAVVLAPIMIPLADMIGLTRQTTILAYQFGDGLANLVWFTYGTLLIFLDYAKTPLSRWYRFVLPLLLILTAVAVLFLWIAVKINYGPA